MVPGMDTRAEAKMMGITPLMFQLQGQIAVLTAICLRPTTRFAY